MAEVEMPVFQQCGTNQPAALLGHAAHCHRLAEAADSSHVGLRDIDPGGVHQLRELEAGSPAALRTRFALAPPRAGARTRRDCRPRSASRGRTGRIPPNRESCAARSRRPPTGTERPTNQRHVGPDGIANRRHHLGVALVGLVESGVGEGAVHRDLGLDRPESQISRPPRPRRRGCPDTLRRCEPPACREA